MQSQSAKTVISLNITSDITKTNDSMSVVKIELPKNSVIRIEMKQLGLLRHKFNDVVSFDTAAIGYGRCQMIYENRYYFKLRLNKNQYPTEGDLLSLQVQLPDCYKGLLFDMSCKAIAFSSVEGNQFYDIEKPFSFKTAIEETEMLNKMVLDIRYTGKEMLKQMPNSNEVLKGGLYDGQKLFDKMQSMEVNDLIKFLKYIRARPSKYTGNNWKISEIFATWMTNETPTVIE